MGKDFELAALKQSTLQSQSLEESKATSTQGLDKHLNASASAVPAFLNGQHKKGFTLVLDQKAQGTVCKEVC